MSTYRVFSGRYFRILENMDQKELRIWTLLTQSLIQGWIITTDKFQSYIRQLFFLIGNLERVFKNFS